MSSITGWLRLEPLPRTTDLEIALEARIADPLWFLARQRQLGEFAGQDAGSPIVARLEAQVSRISRFHAGPTETDAADQAIDYIDQNLPLEVMVEREDVRHQRVNAAMAVEAGLHFARLLDQHGAGQFRSDFIGHYTFVAPADAGFDPDGGAAAQLHSGRVIDGALLHEELLAHLGSAAELTSLPAAPVPSPTAELLAAANDWLVWWSQFVNEPAGAPSAWKPNRLEYGFAVSAELDLPNLSGSGDPSVTLHADEYREGDLDWFAFRAAEGPSLGQSAQPVPPRTVTRTVIPTPVTYSGQPSNRFWGFEDAKVSFGHLSSGAGEVGRFLLAEFALLYGDDWFVLPIDMEVGSVGVVDSLTIVDTFGIETVVPRSVDLNSRWNMFSLTDRRQGPHPADSVFFLPPTLTSPHTSEPVEEVALFRDEMANMVWGVERRILSDNGVVVDRYAEHQEQATVEGRQQLVGDVQDAEVVYRLASTVPKQWIPFVPVPADRQDQLSGAVQLEQRAMLRYGRDANGGAEVEVIEPRGQVLGANNGEPLVLAEEEVPREGAIVDRTFQMVRWTDGSRHVWLGRKVRPGRGEGSSGLRFDYTEPVPSTTSE
jgi:hypothetical protein